MKRRNKLLAGIMAVLLTVSSNAISASAAEGILEDKAQGSLPITKTSRFIQSSYANDSTCSWNKDTVVDESIPTYDLDNNVNGYILNLSTNGKSTGYIVYDTSANELVIVEFGYNNVYTIQGEKVTKETDLGRSKLIPVGMDEYLLQSGTELYTVKNKTNVTDQKSKFQQAVKEKEESIAASVQKQKSEISTKQIIYTSVSVPNLWRSGYQPVTMQMYGNTACTVVFGLNLLKYWTECRGIPSLYNSYDVPALTQTFGRLKVTMNTNANGETDWYDGYNGISSYCSTYACTAPKGSDYKNGLDWNWYKTQIDNGNFTCVNAELRHYQNDGRDGHHSFSGVGYQETSDGNYMRVGDQWTTDYSHFYNVTAYSSSIKNIWYYRW